MASTQCLLLLTFLSILVSSYDRVDANLQPTAGTKDGSQQWGYVEVRPKAHMFWWYYRSPSRVDDPSNPWPIILWLQGGPGASGVGFGNFLEIGPLDLNLKPRNSTWLIKADLLFVDSPVATGFSYVEDENLVVKTDEEAATDLTTLLKALFNGNETLQKSPLFIVAESYGGKFAVTLGVSALRAIEAGELKLQLGVKDHFQVDELLAKGINVTIYNGQSNAHNSISRWDGLKAYLESDRTPLYCGEDGTVTKGFVRGSQEQEAQPHSQGIPTNSWYPQSVISSPTSSRPATPSTTSSSSFSLQRPADRPQSPSHVSPAEAAGIIALLKDKRERTHKIDDFMSRFVTSNFFPLSSGQDSNVSSFLDVLVRVVNDFLEDYAMDMLKLDAMHGENLDKEPRIMELRNQCRIIRTTELAAAQEKLHELERQKEEILKFYSPASLVQAMNTTEEESEALHRQLLDGEIEVGVFLQKYKKLRTTYHRRALTHLAAKTSLTG
ncbi:hypothetical protein RHGRI_007133 [Rhododendron griersonianum]|uniref:VPS37 C-terminal domain-containing protein n=1 Tax=Rhododendron griersonianum TaxID=479676 RepID=A0AAV6KVQ8_9ERIC|nr:hypothetical protein RHGRI_007133 [Rhododendron griersonianum]